MSIDEALLSRVEKITGSDTLSIVPVGDPENLSRGILRADPRKWPKLCNAMLQTFGAVVIASAMMAPAKVFASGSGYDADVYDQGRGQVMQQGVGERMVVLETRPVRMAVQQQQQDNGVIRSAISYGSAAVGGILGSQGGNNPSAHALWGVVGVVGGTVAGEYVNRAVSDSQQPREISGTEITMEDPLSHRVLSVTQAGNQYFRAGEHVLMISTGGSTRVIPDTGANYEKSQSTSYSRSAETHPQNIQEVSRIGVNDVMRAAHDYGVKLDKAMVGELLNTGIRPDQRFTGRVVAVDRDLGLVFQEIGRGAGTVHLIDSLSRVPKTGEVMTVSYNNGLGQVTASREASRGITR